MIPGHETPNEVKKKKNYSTSTCIYLGLTQSGCAKNLYIYEAVIKQSCIEIEITVEVMY